MAYNPVGVTLTTFFSGFFTSVPVVMVTMLAFVMMLWLMIPVTGKDKPSFEKAAKYIGFIVAIIMIGLFISAGGLQIILPGLLQGTIPGLQGIGMDAQDLIIIVLIVVMIIVIIFVTREEGKEEKSDIEWIPVKKR